MQIPFPAVTFVKDLETNNEHINFTETELVGNPMFTYNRYYDYIYSIRGQFLGIVCSRSSKDHDVYYYYLHVPFYFHNNTHLIEVLKIYMKTQQKWFRTRNASWNGIADPPFAEVMTSTIYGKTFGLVEMSDLLHESM